MRQDTTTITVVETQVPTLEDQLSHVEIVANDLKYIVANHETMLEHEGLLRQLDALKEWMESYRAGLLAANKIAETAPNWLPEIKDRLKLASDELHRIEDEGGNPLPKDSAKNVECAVKEAENVQHVITELETLLNRLNPANSDQPPTQ